MSHYEERLERDMGALRERIAAQSERVQQGLENAVLALLQGDHALATNTILSDHKINRSLREIDTACHAFIAVHLPSGQHLRLLSSILRINIGLERIGDYAVTIARASQQLAKPPSGRMAQELESFFGEVKLMIEKAVTGFNELDADLSRRTMALEREMEFELDGLYAELMVNTEQSAAKSLLTTFTVFTQLKRAADQAKNICEDTVFATTGETKAPKIYNILFLDKNNSSTSQMAEALARKAYPGSGNYFSAGSEPADSMSTATVGFLQEKGIGMSEASPSKAAFTDHELTEFHLVVSLQGEVRDYFPKLPFHTAGLEWEVDDLGDSPNEESLTAMYRDLSSRIAELMELMRGKDAP